MKMQRFTPALSTVLLLAFGMASANAGVIIDTGTPVSGGQANLLADTGQSFTTGTLGAENHLSTIAIYGAFTAVPSSPTGPFVLEVYTDTDGNHTTWDPGILVGVSDSQSLPATEPPSLSTFTFSSAPMLSDNTVYLFTYTDGFGTRVDARMGLTNDGDALSDGYLFHQGGMPGFGGGYDTAMQIATTSHDTPYITPSSAFVSFGIAGGPFSPSNTVYTLENISTSDSIGWSAISNETWVSAFPASGTLAPLESVDVTVSINSAATTLSAGAHSASMVFSNHLSGVAQARDVSLEIFHSSTILTVAHPFGSAADMGTWSWQKFTLSDSGFTAFGDPLPLSGDVALNTVDLIKEPGTAGGPSVGDLWLGVFTDPEDIDTLVAVSEQTVNVYDLPGGEVFRYTFDKLDLDLDTEYGFRAIIDDGNGRFNSKDTTWGTMRIRSTSSDIIAGTINNGFASDYDMRIAVTGARDEDLYITPSSALVSFGTIEGPFSPSNRVYTLENISTSDSIDWSAISNETWVSAFPASGTLAPSESVAVTVSINSAAASLPVGSHAASMVFSNQLSDTTQTRDVSLDIVLSSTILTVANPFGSASERGTWAWQKFTLNDSGFTVSGDPLPSDGIVALTAVDLVKEPGTFLASEGNLWLGVFTDPEDIGTLVGISEQTINVYDFPGGEVFGYTFDSLNLDLGTEYGFRAIIDDGNDTFGSEDTDWGNIRIRSTTTDIIAGAISSGAASDYDMRIAVAGILYEDLNITPSSAFASFGLDGGLFAPSNKVYTLENISPSNSIDWSASSNQIWVSASPDSGTLAPSERVDVTVSIHSDTTTLAVGDYAGMVFSNHLSGITQTRDIFLKMAYVDVFTSGTDGYPRYRIPAILTTTSGTVLAFCEARQAGDHSQNDIVLRRSLDMGQTWLPMQILFDNGGDSLNDPLVVQVREGPHAGRIFLFFMSFPEGCHVNCVQPGYGPDSSQNYMMISDDDGATWTSPSNVSTIVRSPVSSAAGTPGQGIQMRHGPHAGRLVFTVRRWPGLEMYAFYSDDGGDTWIRGAEVDESQVDGGGDEVQVAELADGTLMLNTRRFGGTSLRKIAYSHNGGATWTPLEDSTLIEPTCDAGFHRFTDPLDAQSSRLLYVGPYSQSSRINGSIHISYDEGETWPVRKTIYSDGYAYSKATTLPDNRIGILFERDNYAHITFMAVTLDWLTDGADRLSEAGSPVITSMAGATGLMPSAALLNGRLSSTGTAETAVSVFWGETDGALDELAWEQSAVVATNPPTLPGDYTHSARNLLTDTPYYYRYRAGNIHGTNWSSITRFTTLADTDGDGIPDDWETAHSGTSTGCVASAQTGDNDGYNYLEEYLLDFDVAASNAPFKITGIEVVPPVNITFGTTSAQRSYTVEFSTNLMHGAGWVVLYPGVPGSNTTTTITAPATDAQRYYRVTVP